MNYGKRALTSLVQLIIGLSVFATTPSFAQELEVDKGDLNFTPTQYVGERFNTGKIYNPWVDPFAIRSHSHSGDFGQLGDFGVTASDVQDRQFMRDFYNSIYLASEGTPIGWNGNTGTCSPGTTSEVFKQAVNLRINYYRAVAGVPDTITFNATNSAKSQDAAMMMSAGDDLSHFPATNWPCYTNDGSDAAASSNLSLGNNGWDAVRGQMRDNGANNTAAGHRRWLIHPPTQVMGTGDVPDDGGFRRANSVWVFDNNTNNSGPQRDGFVAWPPPGMMPYQIVFPRWSLGVEGADFSSATVTMMSGGSSVPLTQETVSNGAGLNTIVWYPNSLNPNNSGENWPQPNADTTYDVSVSNVGVGGGTQSFNYSVTVFDPGVNLGNEQVASISGPASVNTNENTAFTIASVDHAAEYGVRVGTSAPLSSVEGAESGAGDITDGTDGDYNLIDNSVSASGSSSFHMAHPNAQTQWFVWEKNILVSNSSQLSFASRLGFATSDQTARAQISLDDGVSWLDVFSQAGSGGSGEGSFSTQNISLATHAGKIIKVRFLYEFETGSFFNQTSSGVGWYVDDISVTQADDVTITDEVNNGAATSYNFNPSLAGDYLLQARYFGWHGFPGAAWGVAKQVSASAGSGNTTAVSASVLPTTRSGTIGTTLPAFATIVNGGTEMAENCSIAPISSVDAVFSYQTTDSATNALTGTADTPVDIPGGGSQSFVFSFTPSSAFSPVDVELSFDCSNSAPAGIFPGLNTLLLSSSATPVADVIALVAAPGGIVSMAGTDFGVFAVATSNVGASDTITVRAEAGPNGAALNTLVCETVPATGVCINPPAATVTTSIGAGATPTFGVFVSKVGDDVAFDPANNRAVVVFEDGGGVPRGSSGVAVCSSNLCP